MAGPWAEASLTSSQYFQPQGGVEGEGNLWADLLKGAPLRLLIHIFDFFIRLIFQKWPPANTTFCLPAAFWSWGTETGLFK